MLLEWYSERSNSLWFLGFFEERTFRGGWGLLLKGVQNSSYVRQTNAAVKYRYNATHSDQGNDLRVISDFEERRNEVSFYWVFEWDSAMFVGLYFWKLYSDGEEQQLSFR